MSAIAFWPRKAADSSIMGQCRRTVAWLTKMDGLKSLTLRWRSFLGWGNERVVCPFRYDGDQKTQNVTI